MSSMEARWRKPTVHAAWFWLMLVVIGCAWGATGPFSKLAVSSGHNPIGISFWNTAVCAGAMLVILLVTRRRLPLARRHLIFYMVCGFLGTAFPNVLSYTAYGHLPVGVIQIIIALVPIATLMLALPLGMEKPDAKRLIGLLLGVLAVAMIVLPDASLPDPEMAGWVALPVCVSLAYAGENLYIAKSRPAGCDALTTLAGLSWGAVLQLLPAMILADAWFPLLPPGPPELAIFAIAALHLCAYFGYIWLIGRAGPVFASQVGYFVTASGVLLAMAIFGERHSLWIWGALALMFAGVTLVKPKQEMDEQAYSI